MLDYEKLGVYRTALFLNSTRISHGLWALFDLLNALSYVSPDEYRAGKRLLTRIAAMPSKLRLQLP
jgi:hypothetical protein